MQRSDWARAETNGVWNLLLTHVVHVVQVNDISYVATAFLVLLVSECAMIAGPQNVLSRFAIVIRVMREPRG